MNSTYNRISSILISLIINMIKKRRRIHHPIWMNYIFLLFILNYSFFFVVGWISEREWRRRKNIFSLKSTSIPPYFDSFSSKKQKKQNYLLFHHQW
jgi:hypothetical protein